jgi:predicted DNA-binding protein with PD1-like motif
MKYTKKGNTIVARLFKGEDLIPSIIEICGKEAITSGRVQAIGAVQKAILGYFDIQKKKYVHFECKGEVVSCMGNIAEKEGKREGEKKGEIMVHVHAVIADANGMCKGGHVVTAEASATLEIFIDVIPGLKRSLDVETELFLLDL